VEARDNGEEEWRLGLIVSFDEDGQPRIKVEGFTEAFVWDEHRAEVSTDSAEQSDSEASEDGRCSHSSDSNVSENFRDDCEGESGLKSRLSAWFRREKPEPEPPVHMAAKPQSTDNESNKEPLTLKEYFEKIRQDRDHVMSLDESSVPRERGVEATHSTFSPMTSASSTSSMSSTSSSKQADDGSTPARNKIRSSADAKKAAAARAEARSQGKVSDEKVATEAVQARAAAESNADAKKAAAKRALAKAHAAKTAAGGVDIESALGSGLRQSADTTKSSIPAHDEAKESLQSELSPYFSTKASSHESMSPTWLFRPLKQSGDPGPWRSFRATDQKKLFDATDGGLVAVRGGRWVVDVTKREMRPQYWERKDPITVRTCCWSWKDCKSWAPAGSEQDDALLDEAFVDFVAAVEESTNGRVPDEDLILSHSVVTLSVNRKGDVSVNFKREGEGWASSLFGGKNFLYRGWSGEREAENAGDECPTKHLILVVHGVGESFFSRHDTPLPIFEECVDSVRQIGWELAKPEADMKIEALPIHWHLELEGVKNEIMRSALPSLSRLRAVANELVLDAIMWLSPRWRAVILDSAAKHMREVVLKFKKNNPRWDIEEVTILSHSLGSAIAFELLTGLNLPKSQSLPFVPLNFVSMGSPISYLYGVEEGSPDWLNRRLASMRLHPSGVFRNLFHPNVSFCSAVSISTTQVKAFNNRSFAVRAGPSSVPARNCASPMSSC